MKITAAEAQSAMDSADLLFSKDAVDSAVRQMGERITADLATTDPLFICIMNGGLIPLGALLPHLRFPLRVDYMHATRYRERTFGTELEWKKRQESSLEGQTVVVVDDILDEGYTLRAIMDYCREAGARQVLSAVLVEKRHNRGIPLKADYVGLQASDRYLFGYGMDYKGYWRNADGIYAIAEN